MKTIWITYAWDDNKEKDVDFIAQELEENGLIVKLDRWSIQTGTWLWDQIDRFITDPRNSDAWAIIATQNSLGSEPCKEELAYALHRALDNRGQNFPIIGIFPASVENELIPAAIKTRLYVSLKDEDWVERIVSAVEDRAPVISKHQIKPYQIILHTSPKGIVIEMRPRAGVWAPFFCAILLKEFGSIHPAIRRGPKGKIPGDGVLHVYSEGPSPDNQWWVITAGDEATPTFSYFLFCTTKPSQLSFGTLESQLFYQVDLFAEGEK